MSMAKLDIECCPICCAPVKAIETCNSVRFEYDGPRWISVEERLPENEQIVIGYTPCDGYMFVGYYREEKNWKQWYIVTAMRSTKYMTKKVTHWMPLPEPPKEG
jgi:hypothetical protein